MFVLSKYLLIALLITGCGVKIKPTSGWATCSENGVATIIPVDSTTGLPDFDHRFTAVIDKWHYEDSNDPMFADIEMLGRQAYATLAIPQKMPSRIALFYFSGSALVSIVVKPYDMEKFLNR